MADKKTYKNTVADHMEKKATEDQTRDLPFLIFKDEETTYGQFYQRSSGYAHLFQKLHKASGSSDNVRVAAFMDTVTRRGRRRASRATTSSVRRLPLVVRLICSPGAAARIRSSMSRQ